MNFQPAQFSEEEMQYLEQQQNLDLQREMMRHYMQANTNSDEWHNEEPHIRMMQQASSHKTRQNQFRQGSMTMQINDHNFENQKVNNSLQQKKQK